MEKYIPSIESVKAFFNLLRKEYHLKVTQKTSAAEISRAIDRQQHVTQKLYQQQKKDYDLIRVYKYRPEMQRSIELTRGNIIYSKTKAGKEYTRMSMPWTEPQREFIRNRPHMKPRELTQAFTSHFGFPRSKSSISTMKSRMRRR